MKIMTYYQPYIYSDDGTNISWRFPDDVLYSFQAFATEEDAISFMEKCGYDAGELNIQMYQDDDIEDVVILDCNGNKVE